MPRVALYGGSQVNQPQAFDGRLRAANAGDGGLASSVVQFGKQLGQYADEEAKTRADDLMLQADRRMKEAAQAFKQQAGRNALDARKDAMSALDKARDEVLAGATDPLVRGYLEPVMQKYYGLYSDDMTGHAAQQEKAYTKQVGTSRAANFAENAVLSRDKPDVRAEFIASYRNQIEANLRADGLGDPEIISAETRKGESGVHASIVDSYVADGDIDTANAYFEAHRDSMIAGDETSVSARLLGPMQKREAASEFTRATALPSLAPAQEQATGKPAPVDDGRSVIAGLFPKARITSTYRPKDHALSRANPRSWHTNSNAAIDVAPIPGMAFDQYVKTIEDAGYSIIEAKNEVGKGRSAHATGDHWHVVIGSGGGAQQAARRWDKESVYANIDAIADKEGWSFEKRERVKEYGDGQIARDEQLLARKENEADRQASEVMLQRGDAFTDATTIPRNVWANMSPGARQSALNAAKANSAPKTVKADGDAVTTLELMRINQPEAFAEIPLGQYAHMMTPSELNSLRKDQATIQSGAGSIEVAASVSGAIGRYDTPDLWSTDKKAAAVERVRVQRIMEAEVKAVTGGKRKPTDEELYRAFNSATGTALTFNKTILGMETGGQRTVRRHQIEADEIPAQVADRIKAGLRGRLGIEPNEDQVAEEYRLYKGRFW